MNHAFAEQNIFSVRQGDEKKAQAEKKKPKLDFFSEVRFGNAKGAYVIKHEKFAYRQIVFKVDDIEYRKGLTFDTLVPDNFLECELHERYSQIDFEFGYIQNSRFNWQRESKVTALRLYYDDDPFPLKIAEITEYKRAIPVMVLLKPCKKIRLHIDGESGMYALINIKLTKFDPNEKTIFSTKE